MTQFRGKIATIVAAVMISTPALASPAWETVTHTKCSDASDWSSPIWGTVQDVDDQILDHVCKTRLVYAECVNHPRMTVGQALASIHYKIEFGGNLPRFQCGA